MREIIKKINEQIVLFVSKECDRECTTYWEVSISVNDEIINYVTYYDYDLMNADLNAIEEEFNNITIEY